MMWNEQMCENVKKVKFGAIWWDLVRFGEIGEIRWNWQSAQNDVKRANVWKSQKGEIWWNLVRFGEIWWDLMKLVKLGIFFVFML